MPALCPLLVQARSVQRCETLPASTLYLLFVLSGNTKRYEVLSNTRKWDNPRSRSGVRSIK